MRSADGQKILSSPLSRPLRARPEPGSIGGRFIAHGIAPSTFMPMPKPRPMSQRPPREAPRGRGVSVRLYSPAQRHEDYQRRERPTGFIGGQQCSWCLEPFYDQRMFSLHRNTCDVRPGGPLPVAREFSPCRCEACGTDFEFKSDRRKHIRERLCLMDARPAMCRKCGLWMNSDLDRIQHQDLCSAEGAD